MVGSSGTSDVVLQSKAPLFLPDNDEMVESEDESEEDNNNVAMIPENLEPVNMSVRICKCKYIISSVY
jgi:hypothetical protein